MGEFDDYIPVKTRKAATPSNEFDDYIPVTKKVAVAPTSDISQINAAYQQNRNLFQPQADIARTEAENIYNKARQEQYGQEIREQVAPTLTPEQLDAAALLQTPLGAYNLAQTKAYGGGVYEVPGNVGQISPEEKLLKEQSILSKNAMDAASAGETYVVPGEVKPTDTEANIKYKEWLKAQSEKAAEGRVNTEDYITTQDEYGNKYQVPNPKPYRIYNDADMNYVARALDFGSKFLPDIEAPVPADKTGLVLPSEIKQNEFTKGIAEFANPLDPLWYIPGIGEVAKPLEAAGRLGEKPISELTAKTVKEAAQPTEATLKQEKLVADYKQTETEFGNQMLTINDNIEKGIISPEMGAAAKDAIKMAATDYDAKMTDKLFSNQAGDTEFGKLLKENEPTPPITNEEAIQYLQLEKQSFSPLTPEIKDQFIPIEQKLGQKLRQDPVLKEDWVSARDAFHNGKKYNELELENAIEFGDKHNVPVSYVQIDNVNVGEKNAKLGDIGTDQVLNAEGKIALDTIKEYGGQVILKPSRHGGDEQNVIVIGLHPDELEPVMQLVSKRVDEYNAAHPQKLTEIAHGKGASKGYGIVYDIALANKRSAEDVMLESGHGINEAKMKLMPNTKELLARAKADDPEVANLTDKAILGIIKRTNPKLYKAAKDKDEYEKAINTTRDEEAGRVFPGVVQETSGINKTGATEQAVSSTKTQNYPQAFLGLNERGAVGTDKELPTLIKQSWMVASKDQKVELEKATKELFSVDEEVNKLKTEIEVAKDEVTKTALSKDLAKAEKAKTDAVARVTSIKDKITERTSKPATLVERIDEIAATKKLATENSILLGIKKALGNAFEPMNDRLRKINGVVYSTVQREEFDNLQALTSYFTAGHGWTEMMSALSKGNPKRNIIDKKTGEIVPHEEAKRIFDEYWSALRNPIANFEIDEAGKRVEGFIQKHITAAGEDRYRGAAYARYIASRYGFSEEHKAIRQIFDELQILRKAINPEAGELKYYFPAPIAYGKIEEFRGAVKQSRLRETGQNAVKQLMVDDKIPLDKFVPLSEEELTAIEKNLPSNINDIQRANIIAEAQANKAGYLLTPEKKATIAEEIKKEYNIIQSTDNVWDEALLKGTNEVEKEQIFNDLISGVRKPTLITGKKAAPSRVYEIISDDIRRKYYMSPVDAFAHAVKSTNDLVSEARMFGGFKSLGKGGEIATEIRKSMKGKPEAEIEAAIDEAIKRASEDIFYTEGSLGKAMMEEMKAGRLTKAGADEIRKMIQARYSRLPMHAAVRELRNATYLMTMNSPLSALTQLKDLSMSIILHGGTETARGLYETATQWEPKLNKYARETGTPHQIMSRADLGMEHTIHELLNQDTVSQKTLSRAVENLFSAVGIKQLDRIGKSTFVHAAQIKDARLATEWLEKGNRASPAAKRLNEQVKMFYRDPIEAENVMNELAARQNTEATRLIMFSEATHYYPITQTGVPEAYLRHPNARLLYTLHMFTIKQVNALSKHIAQEIKDNPKIGIPKMFTHLLGLALIGASVDFIKDFVAGKDLSDYADPDKWRMSMSNNLLNVAGLSQFQIEQGIQGREQSLEQSLWKMILPAGISTAIAPGLNVLTGHPDKAVEQTIKMIPFMKLIYDRQFLKEHFGY